MSRLLLPTSPLLGGIVTGEAFTYLEVDSANPWMGRGEIRNPSTTWL